MVCSRVIFNRTLSETKLWENPSPSSDFPAQDVTLSQSMTNFDYIKVVICQAKSELTNKKNFIIPIADFVNTASGNNAGKIYLGIYRWTNEYVRCFWRVSNTQVHITTSMRIGNSGTDQTNNTPYQIWGLK